MKYRKGVSPEDFPMLAVLIGIIVMAFLIGIRWSGFGFNEQLQLNNKYFVLHNDALAQDIKQLLIEPALFDAALKSVNFMGGFGGVQSPSGTIKTDPSIKYDGAVALWSVVTDVENETFESRIPYTFWYDMYKPLLAGDANKFEQQIYPNPQGGNLKFSRNDIAVQEVLVQVIIGAAAGSAIEVKCEGEGCSINAKFEKSGVYIYPVSIKEDKTAKLIFRGSGRPDGEFVGSVRSVFASSYKEGTKIPGSVLASFMPKDALVNSFNAINRVDKISLAVDELGGTLASNWNEVEVYGTKVQRDWLLTATAFAPKGLIVTQFDPTGSSKVFTKIFSSALSDQQLSSRFWYAYDIARTIFERWEAKLEDAKKEIKSRLASQNDNPKDSGWDRQACSKEEGYGSKRGWPHPSASDMANRAVGGSAGVKSHAENAIRAIGYNDLESFVNTLNNQLKATENIEVSIKLEIRVPESGFGSENWRARQGTSCPYSKHEHPQKATSSCTPPCPEGATTCPAPIVVELEYHEVECVLDYGAQYFITVTIKDSKYGIDLQGTPLTFTYKMEGVAVDKG